MMGEGPEAGRQEATIDEKMEETVLCLLHASARLLPIAATRSVARFTDSLLLYRSRVRRSSHEVRFAERA